MIVFVINKYQLRGRSQGTVESTDFYVVHVIPTIHIYHKYISKPWQELQIVSL